MNVVILILSIILTKFVINCKILSKTTEEEWKEKSIPTLGGLVIFVLFVIPMYFTNPLIAFGATLLFMVGVADDIKGLNISFRLFIQSLVSVLLIVHISPLSTIYEALLIYVLCMFLINAFNFIDNSDGLCLGISCFIAACFCTELLIVLLPLFLYNLHGKIYIGDCGSTVLGYLLFFFVLKQVCIVNHSYYGLVLIFAYPIIDTLFVIVRRIIEGQKPWIGDQRHTSHLLTKVFNNQYIALTLIMLFQFVCIWYWFYGGLI